MMECELQVPGQLEQTFGVVEMACGHGALAAAVEVGMWRAFQLLQDQEGWVNIPQMEGALQRSGRRWRRMRPEERFAPDAGGLVLVQWLGSWMEAGPKAACHYRHWAATRAGMVWDINWPERWMTKPAWVQRIVAELQPPKATGWDVIGKWEVAGVPAAAELGI